MIKLACSDEPELWFSRKPSEYKTAQALCQGCPIESFCLEKGLSQEDTYGVWGGKRLKPKNTRTFKDPTGQTLCRSKKHIKTSPGECIACRRERKRKEGRRVRPSKAQKLGGFCHSKKHVLSPENTRTMNDGRLVCISCFHANKKNFFKGTKVDCV